MPAFSEKSERLLAQCDPALRIVFQEVVAHFDCTILCGYRNKEDQNKAFADGKTKVSWPNSKHNRSPSIAVDVAPYPIDWADTARFYYFAGYVLGIAKSRGIELRWGGDWNQDTEVSDNGFNDLVHFELVE